MHTKGPWYADKYGKIWRRDPKELYQYGGGTAGDCPIAYASEGQPSWENKYPVEANARLIAAAPELLEACKRMLLVPGLVSRAEELFSLSARLGDDSLCEDGAEKLRQVDEIVSNAKAAIAKAERG